MGSDGAPASAAQQQQQADALAAAAAQPPAAVTAAVAKPLEPPEPDEYSVSLLVWSEIVTLGIMTRLVALRVRSHVGACIKGTNCVP